MAEPAVAAVSPAPPVVVVVGNLTIDDVVHADGTTTMASLGGNTIHAALGARIWGVPVGMVARAGEDFPVGGLERLRRAGVDTAGVTAVAGPTVRDWVVYEHDGRRSWIHRTPPGRPAEVAPGPGDLPDAWFGASDRPVVVHVAAMPFAAAGGMVAALAACRVATVTLDSHEDWAVGREELMGLARQVTVFLPSREELAAGLGYDDPERACSELVAAGVANVVVKCGGEGSVVGRTGSAPVRVPAAPVQVVDPTGAGDSFCGGVAAGLAAGDDLIAAARRGAATAGAAIGASGSLRLLVRGATAKRLFEAGPDRPADGRRAGPDDSEIMEREIDSIPGVTRDRLALAGQAVQVVDRFRESGVTELVLVGCGDSAFAGEAAVLALNRHSGMRAHWQHALGFARYGVRYLRPGTAVVILSFSGKTGRPIEAAHQAKAFGHLAVGLTGDPGSPLGKVVDLVLPAEIPTFGMSPGTSTYTAMLVTLLTLAASLGGTDPGGRTGAEGLRSDLSRLPALAEQTIELGREISLQAARRLLGARITTFLGAGPNEATAKFGAAKLYEGAQQLASVTNIEEWAHEQYFVTRPGEPVVIVTPVGAAVDRAGEILDEVNFVGAAGIWVSDVAPPGPALHLPLAAGAPEELSPVLASLPVSQIGLHLMRLSGKRSYNFPDPDARREHYDTIHRVTIGEPA